MSIIQENEMNRKSIFTLTQFWNNGGEKDKQERSKTRTRRRRNKNRGVTGMERERRDKRAGRERGDLDGRGGEGREARTREGGCSPNTRDFFLLQESDISRKQWSPSLNAERQKKWASRTYLLSKANEHRASDISWRPGLGAEQWTRQKDDTASVLSGTDPFSFLLEDNGDWSEGVCYASY